MVQNLWSSSDPESANRSRAALLIAAPRSLMRENGRLPKKPLRAESGEGCAVAGAHRKAYTFKIYVASTRFGKYLTELLEVLLKRLFQRRKTQPGSRVNGNEVLLAVPF